ncbi:MAG: hypothetical protein KDI16_14110 [Halioglobus sp.]|nr:hypothetical protein [Halioglobus sp.]
MTIAYFLHVDGSAEHGGELQEWANSRFAPALRDSGQVSRIEAYTPDTAEDPYLASESGKLLMVQADFPTRTDLESTLSKFPVADALASIPARDAVDITVEAFTVRHFSLLDGSTPPRRAPLSFVVRYYPPIDKPASFVDHYVDHHPPIMARFPRIRNILCYFPVHWHDANDLPPSNSFLGNEVVFDSVAHLNAALASEVRHELRADYRQFPPYQGKNTHHAMYRRVLYGGSEN